MRSYNPYNLVFTVDFDGEHLCINNPASGWWECLNLDSVLAIHNDIEFIRFAEAITHN